MSRLPPSTRLDAPRRPREDEAARLAAFLPAPTAARYWLATARAEPSPERIIGAAATWLANPDAPAGPERVAFCRWRVLPRWEAAGEPLSAALLNAVEADAAEAGAGGLYTSDLLPENVPLTAELAARGWTVASRNEFYEGRTADAWARLDRINERLLAEPGGAAALDRLRVETLVPDFFPALRALVLREGLVPVDELEGRLNLLDRLGGYSRIGSRLLLTSSPHPALAAAVLVRLDTLTATIDAQLVDREVCAGVGVGVGAANVRLLRAGLECWAQSGGGELLRFRAHPGIHRQTANFARRCGAALTGTACIWRKTFG